MTRRVGRSLGRLGRKARLTSKDLGRMGRTVGRLRNGLLKMTAVGITAAVTGAGALLNKYAKAGDNLAKFSRRVGVSVKSLQELGFAMDRQGISAESFQKSLLKMSRNIGEARVGTGTLTTFLKKSDRALLKQLKSTTNNEQAFLLLINAMGKLSNEQDKAALAANAFGRSGTDLVSIAKGGVIEIEFLRQKFRELGGGMSKDAAADAEVFVDAMLDAKTSVKNTGIAIGGDLLPLLTPLVQGFTEWIGTSRELIRQNTVTFLKNVGSALESINWRKAGQRLDRMVSIFGSFIDTLDTLTGGNGVLVLFGASLISKVVPALTLFGKTLFTIGAAALANPILIFMTALAVGAAFVIENWEEVETFFVDLLATLTKIFEDLANLIEETLVGVAGSIIGPRARELAVRAGKGEEFEAIAGRARERSSDENLARTLISGLTDDLASKLAQQNPAAAAAAGPSPLLSTLAGVPGVPAVDGQITVDFRNVPAGVTVTAPQQTGSAPVKLQTKVGRASIRTGGE